MHKKVMLELPDGKRRWGYATTEHSASSYNKPVITLDGNAYGPADMGGMQIICSDAETVEILRKSGYNPIMRSSATIKKGIAFPPELYDKISAEANEKSFSQTAIEILEQYYKDADGDTKGTLR